MRWTRFPGSGLEGVATQLTQDHGGGSVTDAGLLHHLGARNIITGLMVMLPAATDIAVVVVDVVDQLGWDDLSLGSKPRGISRHCYFPSISKELWYSQN